MSQKSKTWIFIYSLCIGAMATFYYFLNYKFLINYFGEHIHLTRKVTFAFAAISTILLIRTILVSLIDRMDQQRHEGEQYNLKRITRLIASILILFVGLSSMFTKPYTTLAGLGLVSLVLGFALQTPITSFIAWLYIIIRGTYKVGDRIQIGEQRGDVIEISYLDTILQEVSGDYLGNDRLSGRLIFFPNSVILTDKVINYSGDFEPFIWDETGVQISYTSDLKFVEECLLEAAIKDFQERFPDRNPDEYPPSVYFRINKYAWMEAVVSYTVEPTDTTGRRNRILRNALPLLNAHPDKVGFPEGAKR